MEAQCCVTRLGKRRSAAVASYASDLEPGCVLLRGVLHQAGFAVSLVVGTLLIVGADGASRRAAATVFASSVAVCFGASALYHRVTWTPDLRR